MNDTMLPLFNIPLRKTLIDVNITIYYRWISSQAINKIICKHTKSNGN